MAKKILVGNWKMNLNQATAPVFFRQLKKRLAVQILKKVTVVICPPFTLLALARAELGKTKIKIGAQNVHTAEAGRYTGEVSAAQLKNLAEYVILGHSERRRYFGETDQQVNQKVKTALKHKIRPIVLVGENLSARRRGRTTATVKKQLAAVLKGISQQQVKRLILVYEPVWAISPKAPASPAAARAGLSQIRQSLKSKYSSRIASQVPVLYGGSSDDRNVCRFVTMAGADGVVAGAASLASSKFVKMAQKIAAYS